MLTETSPDIALSPSLGRRILLFPLVRIIVAFFWVMLFPYAISGIFQVLHGPFAVAREVVAAAAGLALYYSFVRVVERRSPDEIALHPSLKESAIGFTWGIAIMGIIVGVLALLGMYHIIGIYGRSALWDITAMSLQSGVLEEIMFRAILFRILEEGMGSIAALLISALMFGLVHGGNPNATMTSNLFIAIEAGPLLAAVYLWRRRLWAAIGLHAGWNFMQAALGAPVSGNDLQGVLIASMTGPALLTGGAFGPEAGLVALVVALVTFAYFMYRAVKRKNLYTPAWMRRASAARQTGKNT